MSTATPLTPLEKEAISYLIAKGWVAQADDPLYFSKHPSSPAHFTFAFMKQVSLDIGSSARKLQFNHTFGFYFSDNFDSDPALAVTIPKGIVNGHENLQASLINGFIRLHNLTKDNIFTFIVPKTKKPLLSTRVEPNLPLGLALKGKHGDLTFHTPTFQEFLLAHRAIFESNDSLSYYEYISKPTKTSFTEPKLSLKDSESLDSDLHAANKRLWEQHKSNLKHASIQESRYELYKKAKTGSLIASYQFVVDNSREGNEYERIESIDFPLPSNFLKQLRK